MVGVLLYLYPISSAVEELKFYHLCKAFDKIKLFSPKTKQLSYCILT